MSQKCILVITDGIGYNKSDKFNAFAAAKKPNYEKLFKEVPNTLLKTSGLAVGLPEGQMGNSEVGHMCIGSGRIIYQNLVRINKAIENGELAQNVNLKAFLKKHKRVHIVGLYSDGGVHSMQTHFNALCEICKNEGKEVFAHAITDGRDVLPTSGLDFIKELENFCEQKGILLASVCGRFYAMDRDKRWERVKVFYDTLFGKAETAQKFSEFIADSYAQEITDEFLQSRINPKFKGLCEDDGVIFVNFRNDRMKEIVTALSADEFKEFQRDFIFKNILTMSVYDEKFALPVLFAKEELENTLASVISKANLSQLHTAETEKYAHVTFFFNGGKEDLEVGESRILVPSPKVKTYDEKPEMSAFEVLEAVKKGMDKGEDFIVVNFANGDMVGHTGDFNAAVKAVEAVDTCLGELVQKARQEDYAFIITSDHGNCEAMQDEKGNLLTNHTTFDVFVFVEAKGVSKLKEGLGLSNLATSVLKILGLEKPKQMNEALF
ncbi:phosphoglycerate mutase (2,3-diphosphoglycerate-independent) [Campylobacter sp. MIT 99-7217]|uniref:2,3-bisphosphoglycerate-independent phosphoglycerate mutase n=1 Tax=Campylobacter sp. MIT 99-7217 TaxID=535091 RepID=UPI001158EC84|nr:2,3-bisphosphoglycerate-independent phosphoglycerate mutase [Campylobacter sp. MIT 99-7217]TQR31384.1 phosphoglycerate mutase (2,3-diphosphoglycerate-independent) [Campylobacter sp. MIT 99-7217]